jgi:structural maintenance of chromosome 4
MKINELKSSAHENNSRHHVLNELLKAQANKELSGIYGRLGDLGAINEKYDVAITTACKFLNHIVT